MASRAVEYTDSWRGVDNAGSARVHLVYDPDDPFAITATFDGDNEWRFARDLLVDGLDEYAGHGDVMVWPSFSAPVVYFALNGRDFNACLLAPRPALERFLRKTLRLVPRGKESFFLHVPDSPAELLEGSDDE